MCFRCAKELNQWDDLHEYAKNHVYDPYLMLESSWHTPHWQVMKEALTNVEYTCPKELSWKVNKLLLSISTYGIFMLCASISQWLTEVKVAKYFFCQILLQRVYYSDLFDFDIKLLICFCFFN